MATLLCILIQIITSHAQVQTYAVKSVTLSPSNMNEDGATIIPLKDVKTRTNSFDIVVSDQIGFHMRVDLDNTWGFHPTKPSSIRIIFDSSTPPNPSRPLAVFLAFSVYDPPLDINEQFALMLKMDNQGNNQISPECIPDLYFLERDVLEEVNNPGFNSRQEIVLDYTDFGKISPGQKDVEPNQWPKEFWLNNDVNGDTFTIQVHNNGVHNIVQSCLFATGFPPQQGLTMFIAADDNHEILNITSITVEYHYETTWHPSISPTKSPTRTATTDPSKTPTQTPINNPTPSPTGDPTIINNAIWNDDFKQDTSGTTGWDIFESTAPPDIKEYYTPDPNPIGIGDWSPYHGPFFWHNAGGLLWMQRYFRCATESDVYLYYALGFCETDSGDKTRSYAINQTVIHVVNNGQAVGTGTDITDAKALAELLTICDTMDNIQVAYPWQYKIRQGGVQINSNGYVNAGDTFLVSLSQGADAVGEATILFDIKVECRQTPTPNPTPAPTDNPTNAPTSMTIAPTTDPTPSPTDQPTPSPTSDPTPAPTADPTPTPTTDPTPAPTADPTPAPTTDPTPAPTADPTLSPTDYPTKNPTETPSLPPTKSDRNTICTSDNSAVLVLSFDYMLKKDITSKNEVKNTLSIAADTFIRDEMDKLTDCIATNYSLHIELSDNSQKATINASICFECNDDEFEIEYTENELNKKFVDIVDSMDESVSIVANSTNIDVDATEHKDGAVHDDTTTTAADTDDSDSKDEEAKKQEFQSLIMNNLTMIIVGVSGVMLICCIVLFTFILKKTRKRKREYNDGRSTEMKKVMSVSMTDMNDVITNAIHPVPNTPCTPNITTSLHTTTHINTAEAEPDHDDDIYLRGASSISTIGGITIGTQQSPKIGPVSNGMDINYDDDDGGDLPDEHSDHESDNELYLETNMRTDDGGFNGMIDDDLGEGNFDNNVDGFIAPQPQIQQNKSNEDSDDDYDALYKPNSVSTVQ